MNCEPEPDASSEPQAALPEREPRRVDEPNAGEGVVAEGTKADPPPEPGPAPEGASPPVASKRWYQRPTVRALIKQAENEASDFHAGWDKHENDESRLPSSEAVHLGGLVLIEAFTPSTVSALYRTLERWPTDRPERKNEWLDQLAQSRSGDAGAWQNLGVVRPPGTFVMGDGHHDDDLPQGVDAVWLHVSYVTPALAMVVATFSLSEEAGDLSGILRADYATQHRNVRLRVYGRFGDLRARIPWSRPKLHGIGYGISPPEDQKKRACASLNTAQEAACGRWFHANFPGRFSRAEAERRPVIRMLFTKEEVPYQRRRAWLRPIGLDFDVPLWKSSELEGWWLTEERWTHPRRRHIMTLAAKRGDAARSPGSGMEGDSNWYLTQRFASDQSPLAARYAMTALLSLYADRLGELRDAAGSARFPRRPVRAGRELDRYLIRDGLDAATVTSDLNVFTRDLNLFRWNVPEFTEFTDHLRPLPAGLKRAEPAGYVPALRDRIREQAARLATDTRVTTDNVKASAELRQAIANTRLQRLILTLSVIAVIIACVSLIRA